MDNAVSCKGKHALLYLWRSSFSFRLTVMIVLGLCLVGVSFAWTSLNRDGSIREMNMRVDAPDNVLISADDTLAGLTTVPFGELDGYAFSDEAGYSVSGVLLPTSYNGTSFYYANVVDEDGSATEPDDDDVDMYSVVPSSRLNLFRVKKDLYMVTTNDYDVTVFVSGIDISQGSTATSNLYRAVRVALSYGSKTVVYCVDGESVRPVHDTENLCDEDFAVQAGDIDLEDDDTTIRITLPAAGGSESAKYVTPQKLTVTIWIEGEDRYAVVDYAGTGFRVGVSLDIVP